MNYYEHHIRDYDAATSHLTWDEDIAYTRMIRWYYRKENPLPADVGEVCRQIRAVGKTQRSAVESVLREFFELREDGWHQQTCDDVIGEFRAGEPEREAKKKNEETRLSRHRAERAELFGIINAAGVHLPWNIQIAELRTVAQRIKNNDLQQPATAPATPATQTATAPNTPATATQTPVPSTQTPVVNPKTEEEHTVSESDIPLDEPKKKDTAPEEPVPTTSAGAVCKAIREAGIQDGNPSHPTLIALIEAGATADEFRCAAREAVLKSKASFAYVIGTVKRRREEAAKLVLHVGRMPNKQEALEQANQAATAGWKPPELREQSL